MSGQVIEIEGKDMQNAVARTEPNAVVSMTPMDMLDRAVTQGASMEVLEKLMALQERWEANQARKSFNDAVAAAKAEIPVITKNREGHNSKRYADFAAYARVVDPILGRHGLGYRFRTVQDERIHVTCILFHKAGHVEENTLAGPADATGSKNAIQAIGSTLTYLQRYSLTQALGLAATEDDDGRAAGNGSAITEEQLDQLRVLAIDVGADLPKFCKYMKVERLEDLPAAKFQNAVAALEAKRAKA
jgi:hypothetical protein